jgi:hypothetical protein
MNERIGIERGAAMIEVGGIWKRVNLDLSNDRSIVGTIKSRKLSFSEICYIMIIGSLHFVVTGLG